MKKKFVFLLCNMGLFRIAYKISAPLAFVWYTRRIDKREKKQAISNKILYYCDRRKCKICNSNCEYTTDITHAKNFELDASGAYIEGEYMRG